MIDHNPAPQWSPAVGVVNVANQVTFASHFSDIVRLLSEAYPRRITLFKLERDSL